VIIVKTLEILLIVFVALIMTACSQQPEIRYIDKPYMVKVPVKCVIPDTNCSFNKSTDTEVISSLLECITDLKRNSEVCK